MIRLVFAFARSRLRREIPLDPALKDLTQNYPVKIQISQLKKQYQVPEADDMTRKKVPMLSEILHADVSKLPPVEYFNVNTAKLNKEMKTLINKHVDKTAKDTIEFEKNKQDFLLSESEMFNQKIELEAEKNFRKELFKKKETQRLINMKINDVTRALQGKEDPELQEYLAAKNMLKNNRIKNMLQGSNKNKELELLMESGLIDSNPQNLQAIMSSLEAQYQKQKLLLDSGYGQTQRNPQNLPALNIETVVENTISNLPLKIDMLENKNFDKLREFFISYLKSRVEDVEEINNNIDTLKGLQLYEEKTFNERYDALNFRYKGQVKWDWMEEPQMLSYIKHDKKLEPKELLSVFHDNFNKLTRSKKNLVITPAVASQLYSKASLFKFPETLRNNKVNMLADPSFIKLEQHLCNNLQKLSNQFFADVVHSFSTNHFEEQGAARPKAFDRMLGKIWLEASDRIQYLEEGDLALICKALTRLPQPYSEYSKNKGESLDTAHFARALEKRIQDVSDVYTLQQVCLLTSLIDDPRVPAALLKSIDSFAKKPQDWDEMTLVNFSRFYPALLLCKDSSIASVARGKLRELIESNTKVIKDQIEKVPINDLRVVSSFLSSINVTSPEIFNPVKKYSVDAIKQQKEKVYARTIPQILASVSHVDYTTKFSSKESQFDPESHIHVQQYFPQNSLSFNSSKFFVYHELLKFVGSQVKYLSPDVISQAIRSSSLVGYKNEGLYDDLLQRLNEQGKLVNCSLKGLIRLVQAYFFQKRLSPYTMDVLDRIIQALGSERPAAKHLNVELWLNLLSSLVNLGLHTQKQYTTNIVSILHKKIFPYLKFMSVERKLSVLAIQALLTESTSLQELQIDSVLALLPPEEITRLKNTQQRLLYSLSLQVLRQSYPKLEPVPRALALSSIQNRFAKKIGEEIKIRQQSIGCAVSRDMVQKSIELRHGIKNADSLPWRVVDEAAKKVELVYTYDMLVHHELASEQQPYGIWRLYRLLYEKKGYSVSIVKSYEWQKVPDEVIV